MWRLLRRLFKPCKNTRRVGIGRRQFHRQCGLAPSTSTNDAAIGVDDSALGHQSTFKSGFDDVPKDVFNNEIASFLTVNELVAFSNGDTSLNNVVEQLDSKCQCCKTLLFDPDRCAPSSGCNRCDQRCGKCNPNCCVCNETLCCDFVYCADCFGHFCPACQQDEMFPCSRCFKTFCSDCDGFTYVCDECDGTFCTNCCPVYHCSGCSQTKCERCNELSSLPINPCTIGACGEAYCTRCQPNQLWVCESPFCMKTCCRDCPRYRRFKQKDFCCEQCKVGSREFAHDLLHAMFRNGAFVAANNNNNINANDDDNAGEQEA